MDLYLREAHFLDESAEDIVRYAEAELLQARARLEAGARDLGGASPEAAISALEALHPSAEGYYACYDELWREVRESATSLDLLTWPEAAPALRAPPVWTQAAAPYLYFLPYRAPAAACWPGRARVPRAAARCECPCGRAASLPPRQQQQLIKLNYVVHHAGIGHHVQNARAAGAASRLGRVAAVDCASRIALSVAGPWRKAGRATLPISPRRRAS